jgi:ribose/xylose/arabinose/galactoside ABC-type transport system permease subunit
MKGQSISTNRATKVKSALGNLAMLFILLAVIIIVSILSPAFLNVRNLLNVLMQVSINGFLAIGMTAVVLTGGIDLSVGSIVGLSGIVAALLSQSGQPLIIVVLGALAVGAFIGLFNGVAISRFNIPPFVATLAMLTIARGITYIVSNGFPVTGLSDSLLFVGSGSLFYIPIPVIILIILFIVFQVLLYQVKIGRYIYAVGGNETAAKVSGINTKNVKMIAYIISGALAGVAGIVLTARVTSGLPLAGQSYELNAIAAVVIGGISLAGGKGKLWGTAIGVLLIGVINNGMDLINVSNYMQFIVQGAIILLAVGVDSARARE